MQPDERKHLSAFENKSALLHTISVTDPISQFLEVHCAGHVAHDGSKDARQSFCPSHELLARQGTTPRQGPARV